jgi:uncharacterized protein
MRKKIGVYVLFLIVGMMGLPAFATDSSASVMTLDWLDLIPESERNMPPPQRALVNHDGERPEQLKFGSVRSDLNGKQVKIPGFVIPLEGDDKKVTEFLLVPFLGACIHVPPPPPNQIVYVKYKGGAPVNGLWDLVSITGTLRTEGVSSELGDTGYLLEGIALEKYQN